MKSNDSFADLIRSIEQNMQQMQQGNGPKEPPYNNGGDPNGAPEMEINSPGFLWFLIPLAVLLFFNQGISYYADWVWYESLNLTSVFTTRILASVGLFAGGAIIFWLFLMINVLLARRFAPEGWMQTPFAPFLGLFNVKRITTVFLAVGAVFALFQGGSASSQWEDVLLYFNQIDFNLMDPIFNQDVSFFVFTLPIWQAAKSWMMASAVITLIITAFITGIGWQDWNVPRAVLLHLSILAGFILLLVAWQYQLDAYQLVYSNRGAVFGAGYTDVHAQLPAYNILSIVTLIAALLLVITAIIRSAWRGVVAVLVVWFAVSILAGNVYPNIVQRFQVSPNELNLEREYIENNIEFTRAAFDLQEIEIRDYDASTALTSQALANEPETVQNIRLWDYRPLLQTYNQIQALRQYYEFSDIDIDRYTIDGEVSQVMLAARELVPERLNENAQTWVNRKLVYTHGYGVAASPVAEVTSDGLPEFLIKDLPSQGVIDIAQPQIYFGEKSALGDYVIARTNEQEFDYPSEQGNAYTSFKANTGIDMSLANRILFAIHHLDVNLLLNADINPDSQLLWRRNITERIREVAPFLVYDNDPYIVIGDDGKLYWFLDAYTYSNRFPYSEPYNRAINYMRNPVKVVTDAYDGTMKFYVIDPEEPITAAYTQIFPDLFTSFDEMPDDLKAHIRYPNDLFNVQSEVYLTYHMTDANEFYNKEDLWAWPQEIFDSKTQRIEPYYVLMQLPDSDDLDFIQIFPFTPAKRENMIAWLAAQNDPDKYGEKLVYQFGKDSLIYGPQQVEARIDQDPLISERLSLWNQQGSNVIRGNLLVIPIGESLLYVEPLYLQAASGKIPEMKQVILATVDKVVMAENLGAALTKLFGSDGLAEAGLDMLIAEGVSEVEPSSAAASLDLSDVSQVELITSANALYQQAQELLRSGDWAGYGDAVSELGATLSRLADVSGVELAVEEAPVDEAPADEGAEEAVESEDSGE